MTMLRITLANGQITERELEWEEEISLMRKIPALCEQEANGFHDYVARNASGMEYSFMRDVNGETVRFAVFDEGARGCCADHYVSFDRETGEWLNGEQYRAKIA